jgi:Ca2+-binding RTX toxin-like protein
VIYGGLGDDAIEGDHGNDLIFGNGPPGTPDTGQDEDDIAGGGSADDGKIFDDNRLNLGANLLDGADTIHGDSANDEVGDDDAAIGDTTQSRDEGPDGQPVDIVGRDVQMGQVMPAPGTFGNDFVAGNGGHDELYGQAGDDAVEGGWGSDAVLGDVGKVTTDLLGADEPTRSASRTGRSPRRSPSSPPTSARTARCSGSSSCSPSTTPSMVWSRAPTSCSAATATTGCTAAPART